MYLNWLKLGSMWVGWFLWTQRADLKRIIKKHIRDEPSLCLSAASCFFVVEGQWSFVLHNTVFNLTVTSLRGKLFLTREPWPYSCLKLLNSRTARPQHMLEAKYLLLTNSASWFRRSMILAGYSYSCIHWHSNIYCIICWHQTKPKLRQLSVNPAHVPHQVWRIWTELFSDT